jgi:hypothetical protein
MSATLALENSFPHLLRIVRRLGDKIVSEQAAQQ